VIAAVVGGAGLAWGSASLEGAGTATIAVVLYSITLNDPVYGALRGVWRRKAAQTGILNCRYSASLTRASSDGSHGDLQQFVEDIGKYASAVLHA